MPPIETDELISDLNAKFERAIGLRYDPGHLVRALGHNLKWDIEIADIAHPHGLVEEVESFRQTLRDALESESPLDFSYKSRIRNNAAKYDLDEKSYLELIDMLEVNAFWAEEILKLDLQY